MDDGSIERMQAVWAAETSAVSYTASAEADDGIEVAAPSCRKRKPLIFRERDITRAIAGHLKAGLSVAGTKIDMTGTIVVLTGQPERVDLAPNETADEWK